MLKKVPRLLVIEVAELRIAKAFEPASQLSETALPNEQGSGGLMLV